MLHPGRHECYGGVAGRAVIVRENVLGIFARGADIVMATGAGSLHAGVIHPEYRDEVVTRVAEGAIIAAGDVFEGFGSGADAAAGGVAAGAVAWRALEYSIDVAVLTRHVPVGVPQFEPRREMVESGALDRKAGRGRQDPEEGQEKRACQG